MKSERVPKAVGTYGARDLLNRRSASPAPRAFLLGRPQMPTLPGRSESAADVEAFRHGEPRIMSCFFQGSFRPYPRRLTYGSLLVSACLTSWTPYLRFPWRRRITIDFQVPCVETRPPGLKELNVDHGQKICDGVMVDKWIVVTARNPKGTLKFVVPYPDVPLVTAWLCRDIGDLPSVPHD